MLVDDAGMTLHFANRYAYAMIEKPGKSLSWIKQALFVISRLYLWPELRGFNLKTLLLYGEFLSSDQVSDVIDPLSSLSAGKKEAYAQAFAKVLALNGIESIVETYLS